MLISPRFFQRMSSEIPCVIAKPRDYPTAETANDDIVQVILFD
jgi:hypothetical protein